jgi:hypothetical protein
LTTENSRALKRAPFVDWNRAVAAFGTPFFDAVRPSLESLRAFPDAGRLNAILDALPRPLFNANGRPLRFCAAAKQHGGPAGNPHPGYEERVDAEGRIEVRPGSWHDFFNAMAWLAWPRAKAALNRVHAAEIRCTPGVAARRGAARDAATLFDEAGAVVACSDAELAGLLRGFRWKALFVARRADAESRLRCFLVGHSLLDKALSPYKGLTANALVFAVPAEFLRMPAVEQVAALDGLLAAWLADPAHLDAAAPFSPLPLLGLPGFCDGNADPAFYDDPAVFRPGRTRVA